MTREQRRAPRYAADWSARYRFDPIAAWRECRLIDISKTGMALELFGLNPDETVDGALHMELVSMSGDADGVQIHGEIRYLRRSSTGRVRVGMEFDTLSAAETKLLDLLVRLRVAV